MKLPLTPAAQFNTGQSREEIGIHPASQGHGTRKRVHLACMQRSSKHKQNAEEHAKRVGSVLVIVVWLAVIAGGLALFANVSSVVALRFWLKSRSTANGALSCSSPPVSRSAERATETAGERVAERRAHGENERQHARQEGHTKTQADHKLRRFDTSNGLQTSVK